MLATQLNGLVESGQLEANTVIQLEKYLCNKVQPDRKVVIMLQVSVVAPGAEVGGMIGSPVTYQSTAGDTQANSNAPAASATKPNVSAPPAKKPSFYSNKAPAMPVGGNQERTPGSTQAAIFPIDSLTPYQNRWSIKVRVTKKSSIRTWSNSRGDGKLFSLDLIDESGEIRATAFNQECDKYFDMLELDKVYIISKAQLKTANKNFTTIKNDYEMTFSRDTEVTLCMDESANIPKMSFNFVPISELAKVQKDAMIDVVGVCKSAGDLATIMTKTTNRELSKRDITLVDGTQTEVRLTIWGEEAEKFNADNMPVIAVKGARVSDFGGVSLSVLMSSTLMINPDIEEAHKLRGWWDTEGLNTQTQSLSNLVGGGGGGPANWKTFMEMKTENLGHGDKPDYFSVKATAVFFRKENCLYQACPTEQCNKKVIDNGDNTFRCEKCAKDFDSFKWRMLLSMNLADFTDSAWVTCFSDAGAQVLGVDASALGTYKTDDEDKFHQVFTEATFKPHIFKLRTKMETYNDESRLKTVCMMAQPVNWCEYNQRLIDDIQRMMAM
ncbi:PREDICTED: replication protein A 70 kDa DNA-binding subunit-like [Priapulus caudatus]|uniref:Replication protein A subunit n=1 Tax=Priapulus caudatus TaxID=37621 RepID=A0ABM1EYV2_PRICU|nr:PREDICTED: replication protein A 70 kDa DNA-binding subunit-like [Priapulus caudatus]